MRPFQSNRLALLMAISALGFACSAQEPTSEQPAARAEGLVKQWRSASGTATLSPASAHWTQDPESGAIDAVGAKLEDLIVLAYGLDNARAIDFAVEVPREPAYDVQVRPADGKVATAQRLLREMLEESFSFRTERERREVPTVVLRRHPRRRPLAPSQAPERVIDARWGRFEATRAPLSELTRFLQIRSGRPVLDETGLDGEFDFVLEWDPAGGDNALLLALNDLGLEMTDGSGPQDVLIVRARN